MKCSVPSLNANRRAAYLYRVASSPAMFINDCIAFQCCCSSANTRSAAHALTHTHTHLHTHQGSIRRIGFDSISISRSKSMSMQMRNCKDEAAAAALFIGYTFVSCFWFSCLWLSLFTRFFVFASSCNGQAMSSLVAYQLATFLPFAFALGTSFFFSFLCVFFFVFSLFQTWCPVTICFGCFAFSISWCIISQQPIELMISALNVY